MVADVAEASLTEGIILTVLIGRFSHYFTSFSKPSATPANRVLANYVKQRLGADKGNSLYLMGLFRVHPLAWAAASRGSQAQELPVTPLQLLDYRPDECESLFHEKTEGALRLFSAWRYQTRETCVATEWLSPESRVQGLA